MAKAFNLAAPREPENRAILGTIFLWRTNDVDPDAGESAF